MTQENKGYVNTCTNQPVDSLLQTVVIAQVDECTGPVVKTYVQCSKLMFWQDKYSILHKYTCRRLFLCKMPDCKN